MKKKLFSLYNWITVIAWYALIYLTGVLKGSDYNNSDNTTIFFNLVSYQFAFGILFLLIFRSILSELRLKINRLMYYKSKREKSEDLEFTKVVEVLVLFLSITLSILAVVFTEYMQITMDDKIVSINDLLSNVAGVLLFAALTFVLPHIYEFEMRIAKKINLKSKK